MITITRKTVFALFVLASIASSANAFDGKRKGFILGFGAGYETITPIGTYISNRHTRGGLQTTLDIGGGVSDQWLILYSGHTTLNLSNNTYQDKLVWFESSVIVRCHFSREVKSFYAFAGPALALGTGMNYSDDFVASGGIGVTGGVGYQFDPKFHIQLGTVVVRGDYTFASVHLTLNLIGY